MTTDALPLAQLDELTERTIQQLYCRECAEQTLIEREQLDSTLAQSNDYAVWRATKRPLTQQDVIESHWVKSCTAGYITELYFNADGSLTEHRLFDRFETQGQWRIEHGLLHIEITKADNRYQFGVVGNATPNIHSAIEYKNGELHSYLKLAQVK